MLNDTLAVTKLAPASVASVDSVEARVDCAVRINGSVVPCPDVTLGDAVVPVDSAGDVIRWSPAVERSVGDLRIHICPGCRECTRVDMGSEARVLKTSAWCGSHVCWVEVADLSPFLCRRVDWICVPADVRDAGDFSRADKALRNRSGPVDPDVLSLRRFVEWS